jgi:hypothetical protein
MAPGADRTADPETYTYTALTARTRQNAMVITRGRRSGSSAFVEPAQSTVPLTASSDDTQTDSLVKGQARSEYHPHIRRGLVCRYYVNEGARWLRLTGATGGRFATTDKATLDITGDLYVAVQYRCPIILPAAGAGDYQVVGKHNGAGNQRSWLHQLNEYGGLEFFWSTTGADFPQAISELPVPRPDLGDLTVGMYLDVNNGAGGHNVYFWAYKGTIVELNAALAANERRWRLGEPFDGVGVTSVFSSSAPLEIGDISNSSGPPYAGGINALEVRAGNWAGTVAANPDFTTQAVGATSFSDTAPTPNTWTQAGTAAITDRKIRLIGELGSNTLTLPGHGREGTGQVTWEINGLLRRLRLGNPPLSSALFARITAPENAALVDGYWPMEDGRGATSFFSPIAGVRPITTYSGMDLAADSSLISSKPLPSVAANDPWGYNVPLSGATSGTWEVTWVIKIEDPGATARAIGVITASGTARTWLIQVDNTQIIVAAFNASGGGLLLDTIPWDATDMPYWSIVRLEVVQNGANIDWVLHWIPIEGPGLGTDFTADGSFAATAGAITRLSNLALAPASGLSMGHLVATSGTLESWLASADVAHTGEAPAARAFRLCRQAGVPILIDGAYSQQPYSVVDVNALAGETQMGPQPITDLLGALEECAVAAAGFVGEATETLALTFRSGWTLNNQDPAVTTTTATVQPFDPTDDDRDIVNDGTATRAGGSSGRYVDDENQSLEGDYPDSRQVNVLDGLLTDHAAWWVHEATTPEMRIPSLTIEVAKDEAAMIDPWLSTSLGDVVRADDLPAVLPESSTDQLLDGFTETIAAGRWTVATNGRPAAPYRVGVLDDSTPTTSLARLDKTGATLAEDLTTTETAVDVAFSGIRFVTTAGEPAQFPFDIEVGGEQMTVTAIAATTSPQTFTVTRSVNGVVKTHATGAEVHVFYPLRPVN